LNIRVPLGHALKLYRCESATDEFSHRLEFDPLGKQNIHVAAMRCHGQRFEHVAMFPTDTLILIFGLRGHFRPSTTEMTDPLLGRTGREIQL